jgi:hypothetical protein
MQVWERCERYRLALQHIHRRNLICGDRYWLPGCKRRHYASRRLRLDDNDPRRPMLSGEASPAGPRGRQPPDAGLNRHRINAIVSQLESCRSTSAKAVKYPAVTS